MKNSWDVWLKNEFQQEYFQIINKFINNAYGHQLCLPERKNLFRVFETPKEKIKVVILGQDPYPQPKIANGLAFSVNKEQKLPKSLINIFKEVTNSYPGIKLQNGDLSSWAAEGVFLLNTALTVAPYAANSHQKIGWAKFTNKVIEEINQNCEFVVFVLWGKKAQQIKHFINTNKHKILETSHPSPLSARISFFGSKIFYKINVFLKEQKLPTINWALIN